MTARKALMMVPEMEPAEAGAVLMREPTLVVVVAAAAVVVVGAKYRNGTAIPISETKRRS